MQNYHATELRPAVKKKLFMLIASLFFLVGGIAVIREGSITGLVGGIIGIVYGIVGISLTLVSIFSKRMVLRLTPEGFAYGTLWKKHFYRWNDIAVFGTGSVCVRLTCFTLRGDYAGEEKLRIINQRSIGFDRFLPDTYGKTPTELAKLLEDWRYRYSIIKSTEFQ
jgi:hypothetical protein